MGKESKHSGGREIWAVVLVGLSLLLLLSLISYDPYDVGHVAASRRKPVANFIGPVGAWIAFGTFQTFGMAAYGLMAVLAVIGGTLLLGKELPWRGKVGAGVLLLVSLSGLLHVAGLERGRVPRTVCRRVLPENPRHRRYDDHLCRHVSHQPRSAHQFPSELLGGVDRRHGDGFLEALAREVEAERLG